MDKRQKILIVDDAKFNRDILRAIGTGTVANNVSLLARYVSL